MTANDARSQVARMNARFLESDLAVAVNPATLSKKGDRTRVTWPQANTTQGIFSDEIYASISEYRAFFYGNHYTCLLNDGALIQVSFDFKNDRMVAHRFCYYPSPLAIPNSVDVADWEIWNDMLEKELFSQIEALEPLAPDDTEGNVIPTTSMLRLRSPIRFDYDPDRQTATEPSSHVHLSDARARVPVHAALSLAQFVHFVISHFYPDYSALLADFAITYHDRCIRVEDERVLHLDWRRHL